MRNQLSRTRSHGVLPMQPVVRCYYRNGLMATLCSYLILTDRQNPRMIFIVANQRLDCLILDQLQGRSQQYVASDNDPACRRDGSRAPKGSLLRYLSRHHRVNARHKVKRIRA